MNCTFQTSEDGGLRDTLAEYLVYMSTGIHCFSGADVDKLDNKMTEDRIQSLSSFARLSIQRCQKIILEKNTSRLNSEATWSCDLSTPCKVKVTSLCD